MTTINTIEDFVRLLDEHPQWVDAVRARVLTRDLIELPQTLANLATGTYERFAAQDRRFDKVEGDITDIKGKLAEHDKRFDKIEGKLAEHDKRFDKIEGKLAEHDKRFDKVEGSIEALRDDIAPIKGTHARDTAIREAGLIAADMGYVLVRVLDVEQVRVLSLSEDAAGIPSNDLRSFHKADLVMEVTDRDGDTRYVAAEVSFTANGRDTSRAIRNAGLLTRFTGKPSDAAVAGVRRDDRIEESIEAGEVFWYQLDEHQAE